MRHYVGLSTKNYSIDHGIYPLGSCMTEGDHQLLTNKGWMTLTEVLAYRESNDDLRFASFDKEEETLIYDVARDIIVNPASRQTVVEFGRDVECARFDTNKTDDFGTTDRTQPSTDSLTLRVTKDHDMWVQHGHRSGATSTPIFKKDEWHKVQAGDFLSTGKYADAHRTAPGAATEAVIGFVTVTSTQPGDDASRSTVATARTDLALALETDVREVEYEGRTWCASMPKGFIVARRVRFNDAGVVTCASIPVVVCNCTMKYNPRINEKVCRLPGLADIHPNQPESTVQGMLAVLWNLQEALKTITGMPGITIAPAAGSHGELTGLMAMKQALSERDEHGRNIMIVPESAHGTNPASAVMCGFKVVSVRANKEGTVDLDAFNALLEKHQGKVAGMMLTNPNTLGIFERDIKAMADSIHAAGGYFYCDGANFNALMGSALVSSFDVDAMHINVHKTFSTPHGGGGPGAGPVVFSERLIDHAPVPQVVREGNTFRLVDETERPATLGRVKGFVGQIGVLVRALAYIMALGPDGIAQSSKDAIMNANYLQARLKDTYTAPFGDHHCLHECVMSDAHLKGTDTRKALR